MKSCVPKLLLGLALTLLTHFCHAQTSDPAPLTAAITQLDTDLLAIPADSTVTDAQHQTIVTDLTALAVGIVPAPATADIDSIATTLVNAAIAGNVTADALAELNTDLAADATDADDWTDDITDDANTLLSPADADPGDDPNLPIETAGPVFVTAASPRPRRSHLSREFELSVEGGQSPSNQFYDGNVEFVTRQVDGSAAETKVYVVAVGLPRSNPYTLTVTRKSDGAVVPIGRFNVKNVSTREFNLYLTAAIPDDYQQRLENITLAKTIFGGDNVKRAVPAGFDVQDIATIALVDAQGVARLSGQASIANRYYDNQGEVLHLYGDPVAAPAALGVAKTNRAAYYGVNFAYTAFSRPVTCPPTRR